MFEDKMQFYGNVYLNKQVHRVSITWRITKEKLFQEYFQWLDG